MSSVKGVEAVDRALQILECFGSESGELSLAELSRRTDLYKSTVLRMLASLERFGFTARTTTGRYRLGPAVWRLGSAYRDGFDLSDVMRPELDRLAEATNETASYFIREGDTRVCLFRSEPVRSIRHSLSVGSRMPLDRGASGRVLRAFGGEASDACESVRRMGFSVSRGERDPEVGAVAVPLVSDRHALLGVISVSGLVTRFDDGRCEELLKELRISQQRLLARLSST